MAYTLKDNQEYKFIAIKVEGDFGLSVLKQLAAESSKLVKKHNCYHILNDLREATITSGTLDI